MRGQVRLLQSPGRKRAQAPGLGHRGPLQGLSLCCPLTTNEGQPLSSGLIQQVWGGVYRQPGARMHHPNRLLQQVLLPTKPGLFTRKAPKRCLRSNQGLWKSGCTSVYKNKSHMKNFTKKWAKCFNPLASSSVASTQVMPPFTRWQDRWPLRPGIWDTQGHQHLLPPTTWRAPIFYWVTWSHFVGHHYALGMVLSPGIQCGLSDREAGTALGSSIETGTNLDMPNTMEDVTSKNRTPFRFRGNGHSISSPQGSLAVHKAGKKGGSQIRPVDRTAWFMYPPKNVLKSMPSYCQSVPEFNKSLYLA